MNQVHKVQSYSDGQESNSSLKAHTLHIGALQVTKYFELHINTEQVEDMFMFVQQTQPQNRNIRRANKFFENVENI